jgi:hypothetical protein
MVGKRGVREKRERGRGGELGEREWRRKRRGN